MDENWIQVIAVYAIPVIFAITLHEAAHGWMAQHEVLDGKQGGDTSSQEADADNGARANGGFR